MKGLLITIKGGENAAKNEIEELINANCTICDRSVEFEFEKIEDLFKLCFFSQVARKILLLDELDNYLKEGMSFCVRCEDTNLEREIGAEINKNNIYKVDLENPEILVYHFNGKNGIDFTGDISKREFRIFTNKHTLKGTTAAILLKEADYTGKEKTLDCFTQDGTIILEAAHMSIGRSVRYFDWDKMNFIKFDNFKDFDFEEFFEGFKPKKQKNKIHGSSYDLREVNAIKKNAKIAGVNKEIEFAKKEIEFLDQKFDENEIDLLVSHIPRLSEKMMNEFYHQAEYIAKKVILLVEKNFECNNKLFEIKKEKILEIGKTKKKIIWLKKK